MDFPRTNVLGFIDFLLENLKEKASSLSFAKLLILAIEEKLLSVRDYLKDLVQQQNEIQELKNQWIRITNAAYAVEHVIDSCLFEDGTIWHKMIALSIFKDEIELTMTEVKKIRDEFVNNVQRRNIAEMNSSFTISKHVKNSRINEPIVGFKNEATEIIDELTRGSRELKIVSIVGMPGRGKTTLASHVYNDTSVKYHFHHLAWCFVSQAYKRTELLLNILGGVIGKEDIHSMSEEDLAERLYKCLKGQRYLIVMHDIWDIKAWDELKESFPNDSNGSRIIFTSRIQCMASRANVRSSTHRVLRLSIEESWELLQMKLFNEDCCPPYLSEVGMRIAEICEGLPLALVVTAGILARRVKDLDWWKEIEGDLSSKILSEGCINLLELSYKHLPDTLKPCFLYFVAFQKGKPVNARRLTQLWVAERFFSKAAVIGPEDVAQDFLMDLIDRSLVTVAKTSSRMRIKECCVHDLLFDLLTKIEQDNFLRPLKKNSRYPPNVEDKEYRLSIQNTWSPFIESNPTILHARTLLSDGHEKFVCEDTSFYMKFKFLKSVGL